MSQWETTESDGMVGSVFDIGAVGAAANMYKAWVSPAEYPDERQPRLENWSWEDKVAYCGGTYASAAYRVGFYAK